MFIVEYYEKSNGNRPVEEFILSLDYKLQAKVSRSINLLEEFGINTRKPYSEKLEDDIFELRIIQGNNIARILYFFDKNKIILVNAFIKKTRKTPRKEIILAKKRRLLYLSRRRQNG